MVGMKLIQHSQSCVSVDFLFELLLLRSCCVCLLFCVCVDRWLSCFFVAFCSDFRVLASVAVRCCLFCCFCSYCGGSVDLTTRFQIFSIFELTEHFLFWLARRVNIKNKTICSVIEQLQLWCKAHIADTLQGGENNQLHCRFVWGTEFLRKASSYVSVDTRDTRMQAHTNKYMF